MGSRRHNNWFLILGLGGILFGIALMVYLNFEHQLHMHDSHQRRHELIDKTTIVDKMRRLVGKRYASLTLIPLLDDFFDRDEELQRFNAYAREFLLARDALLKTHLSPSEKQLLNNAWRKIVGAQKPIQNAMTLLVNYGDTPEAKAAGEYAKSLLTGVIDQLDVFVVAVNDAAQLNETKIDEKMQSRLRLIITIGLTIFLLSIITAVTVVYVDRRGRFKITEATRIAETANAAKSDFLAHMSHELRTPLNSIIGYSEMVREEVFGKIGVDKYLEYINDIHESGHHLLHLINDVLDLSKIEAGEFQIDEGEVDLSELLNSCLRIILGRKETKSVSVDYEPDDKLPHLWVDERLIKQVVLNLLSNAVKYNKVGGTVSLSASADDKGALSIVVTDTGIGIAAKNIPKVLEPFGQARTDSQLAHEGTGLGLSLSKQLAYLHGGTLEIESELERGTTVTVTFPPERTVVR